MSVAPVLLFVVVFEVERVVFAVPQVSVAAHVVGVVGIALFGSPGVDVAGRFVVVFVFVLVGGAVTGGAVESSPEQFFCGCDAVVGFEIAQVALHDIDEEADGISAVGGFQLDDVCDALVEA